MIPLQTLREKPQYVIERLKVKNFEAEEIVNNILSLDEERRKTQKAWMKSWPNRISWPVKLVFCSSKAELPRPTK